MPIPTWEQLDEPTRSRLVAAHRRARASYVGRKLLREVRIPSSLTIRRGTSNVPRCYQGTSLPDGVPPCGLDARLR